MDQEPERDYTPDEEEGVVHYAPGDQPLCGNDSITAVYTDDPEQVAWVGELPPLPARDLRPERRRVAARRPSALPALREARMVKWSEIAV